MIKYNFGPRPTGDHRIERPHSAVVIQTAVLSENEKYGLIVVLYITSTPKAGGLYLRIASTPENGLEHESTVDCSQYYTLRKDEDIDIVGELSKADLYQVKERIKLFFSINF